MTFTSELNERIDALRECERAIRQVGSLALRRARRARKEGKNQSMRETTPRRIPRDDSKKLFRVGTFCEAGETRVSKVRCYTSTYNTVWPNCREFDVEAKNGYEAKKIAARLRLAYEVII